MNCCTLLFALTIVLALCRHGAVAQAGCRRRYMRRINGKCYYFSVVKLNWFGALNNCLRKGLVLAELANPGDFNGVVGFLTSVGTQEDFWFAGNDLQTEGRFQYITSARLVRYFSNYSIIDPAEASACDDCLEVRLRPKLSVVADDNCLERQYFICSERYCAVGSNVKKKLHHSHEHLHHFHHDIEVEDNEQEEEDNFDRGSESGWDQMADGSGVGGDQNSDALEGVENQEIPPWGAQASNAGGDKAVEPQPGGAYGRNSAVSADKGNEVRRAAAGNAGGGKVVNRGSGGAESDKAKYFGGDAGGGTVVSRTKGPT